MCVCVCVCVCACACACACVMYKDYKCKMTCEWSEPPSHVNGLIYDHIRHCTYYNGICEF